MNWLGLPLTQVPMARSQALRHSTASMLAAVLAIATLALVRPGALSESAVFAGVAIPLAWSHLVDCGHAWSRMDRRQRGAAGSFVGVAAMLAAAFGHWAHLASQ